MPLKSVMHLENRVIGALASEMGQCAEEMKSGALRSCEE